MKKKTKNFSSFLKILIKCDRSIQIPHCYHKFTCFSDRLIIDSNKFKVNWVESVLKKNGLVWVQRNFLESL